MRKLASLVLTATFLVAGSTTSVGRADPPPPPGHEHDHDRDRDRDRDKPGAEPRGYAEYAARLQKLEDDRRAKRAEERRDQKAWEAARERREAERRRELEVIWGQEFLRRPECRAEMELDAERVARLDRIIDIAEDTHNAALLARARAVLAREVRRHARVMAELRLRLGVQ
jgi:hypothetical protein